MKPFTLEEVRRIKAYLELRNNKRDLAILCCAYESMLRASDLLSLRLVDVLNGNGGIKSEVIIRQQKTGNRTIFALPPYCQHVIMDWIGSVGLQRQDYLFVSLRSIHGPALSSDSYRRLIKKWVREALKKPADSYSSHSLRRTKPSIIYAETRDIEGIRQLLGHASLASTSAYLNIGYKDALRLSERYQL